MDMLAKILKNLLIILSAFKSLWTLFRKPVTPEEVKKEEIRVKDEVKKGDIDKLNEELGWKDINN